MKKTVLTLALAAAGTVAFAGTGEIQTPPGAEIVPNSFIVVFQDGTTVDRGSVGFTVQQVGIDMAARYGGRVTHTFEKAVHGMAIEMSEDAARILAADPKVRYIERNAYVHIIATQTNPPSYGIDRVDQRNLPLNNTYNFDFDGTGVHAYIIDTGIRVTHQEFGGRATGDFTAINDGNGSNDCNGHGTHVSGTVGGINVGIAKNVRLHAVRVLDCNGSGTNAGVIQGMDFVTANHQSPAVANMSLGGGASQAVDDAVQRMVDSGVALAVAAGNSNADACGSSPSRAPAAVTVGSTTSTDARSSFSNFGTCVDIFAPGSSIISSVNTSDTARATFSGTSMASPHVAGALALLRQANPGASVATIVSTLIGNATTGVVSGAGAGSPNRLLFTNPGAAPPPNDVFFDNMENGDGGWALSTAAGSNTATTGRWERGDPQGTTSGITLQNNTTPSGSMALVTGATAGASAGANDVDGGVTTIDSRTIALPAGATLTLRFSFYFAHLNNSGADDFFRAFIVNSAGTATQVFQELGTAANDAGTYATQSVNISQFAGQTIRIRFQAADNGTGSLVEAAVDDVRISR